MLIAAFLVDVLSFFVFIPVEYLAYFAALECDKEIYADHLLNDNTIHHCYLIYTMPPAVIFLTSIIVSVYFIFRKNGRLAALFSVAPFITCFVLISVVQFYLFSKMTPVH